MEAEYKFDVWLIPLGGCDMVLGIQWLKRLGEVKWDFNNLIMEFDYYAKHQILKGTPPHRVKKVKGSHSLLISANQLYMIQLVASSPRMEGDFTLMRLEKTNGISVLSYIISLLYKFSDVFFELKGLPPS